MLLNKFGLPEADDLQHLKPGIHKLEWYEDPSMSMVIQPAYIKIVAKTEDNNQIVSVALQAHLL